MSKSKLAANIFSSVSKVYDKFLSSFTLGAIHKWQDELINNTHLGKNILDIGTGTGEIVKKIHKKQKNSLIVGLDISKGMLKTAKEKNPDVFFVLADAEKLPFRDKSLENIFFSLTFRHLNIEKTSKECKRVLKTGGYLSILDIPKPSFKPIYYLFVFFLDILFRPLGRIIFSKEEYDYFVHSIKYALTTKELEDLFLKEGFNLSYKSQKMFGLLFIMVFTKQV